MSKGFFTDKALKPANSDILNILGNAYANWHNLYDHLNSDLNLKGELKFYGRNYGWALRFCKSGKSVIALYPNQDFFTIQIILNENQIAQVLTNITDKAIIQIITSTESIHEGKWIYTAVDAQSSIKDILKMIEIRLRIK